MLYLALLWIRWTVNFSFLFLGVCDTKKSILVHDTSMCWVELGCGFRQHAHMFSQFLYAFKTAGRFTRGMSGTVKSCGSLRCQHDSYARSLNSVVVSCQPAEAHGGASDKFEVVLEDTVLFPEGGGQVGVVKSTLPLYYMEELLCLCTIIYHHYLRRESGNVRCPCLCHFLQLPRRGGGGAL